jgi:hypothetical protein
MQEDLEMKSENIINLKNQTHSVDDGLPIKVTQGKLCFQW